MLKESVYKMAPSVIITGVLILILMEHAQRATSVRGVLQTPQPVLILILMEHAQREVLKWLTLLALTVLILILMEHAQRAVTSKVINAKLEQS